MTFHHSLCVHAHFYQPPREDPLSKRIPDEFGAEPFRNWNERVLETCYRPNAELGNYRRISFNIGPTLASWMAENSNDVLTKIIEEDRRNVEDYGVGNALAQAYNHTILPLSKRRDKSTQVSWGIEAFKKIFGRTPQGMWLPETAVDCETLTVLAENGIEFTILAPWQIEPLSDAVNPPYHVELDGGRSIIVFTYDAELSSNVSFNSQATSNADTFAEQMLIPIIRRYPVNSLTMIATDGELYGHHQAFRDKFLAHLVNGSTSGRGVKVTYPALWLKENPVTGVAKLRENSSWSCHHGIDRWQKPCGCGAHSHWKKPLRDAMNILADAIDVQFENYLCEIQADPWETRDKYIDVLLGKCSFSEWIESLKSDSLASVESEKLSKLFMSQYERQRMFTSCGWFFNDLDRIEPLNNINYAAHAVWLMKQVTDFNLPKDFMILLTTAMGEKTGLSAKDRFLEALSKFSAEGS